MRVSVLLGSALFIGCGSPPAPLDRPQPDPTIERWYVQGVIELANVNREAKTSFQTGKSDAAAELVMRGESLSSRLLSVPRPTLAATEAASDLDQLYGQMFFSNRNYGWARLLYQKNLARWKYWKPQTPDTVRRLKQARSAIAECDRRMSE